MGTFKKQQKTLRNKIMMKEVKIFGRRVRK
jgi:hypothetical protein